MADKLGPLGCDNLGLPLEATWQQRFQHLQPKEAGGTPPSADLLAGAKGHQGHGRGENLLLEAKGNFPVLSLRVCTASTHLATKILSLQSEVLAVVRYVWIF